MRGRYGTELTLPLLVQQESARQRLARAAEVQARERADGWIIVDAERKFELPVDGIVLAGKIDRIERHEGTGRWRVLDYKTSDAAARPAEVHLRPLRRDEEVPAWARWEGSGRPRAWSDLQLLLYQRVLAADAGGAPVDCAYFNLPKAIGETGLAPWADCTPELQEAGWRCAREVVAAIRAGRFWPPRELTGREAELDEFAPLFHGGAAASVAWEDRS
jgi:ATP-dependent helicase/nuclease subunit B